MDNLRRIGIPVRSISRIRRRGMRPGRVRMSKAESRLATALDQLRDGVPLNWTQIEEDPELVALARLHRITGAARGQGWEPVPPDLYARTLERAATQLSTPRKVVQKPVPRTLAGFSESVQVLTQVEDDIPSLTNRMPQWILATSAAGALIALLMWIATPLLGPPHSDLQWIHLEAAGKTVLASNLPPNYKAPRCPAEDGTTHPITATRHYIPEPDRQKAQADVDFPIQYPPDTVSAVTTYTLSPVEAAVSPCGLLGSIPLSSLRLQYLAKYDTPVTGVRLAPLTIFESVKQAIAMEVAGGTWKRVAAGGGKGILWQGPAYTDQSGNNWTGTTNVLLTEYKGVTSIYVGSEEQGITADMLLSLATQQTGGAATKNTLSPGNSEAAQTVMPFVPGVPNSLKR